MSKFDRYLLSQLMTLFGFFALILVAVYWVNRAVRLFDQLISDGQSAWVFFEFTALSLPYNIRVVLPVAAFIAAVYMTNRLSSESELAVMKATGFSPWRLARPVLVFGLILGLAMALLSHLLEPMARTQLADRRGEISANISQRILTEGRFVNPAKGVMMFITSISDTGELRDVFISDSRDETRSTTYSADRAALVRADSGPKLVMFDGMIQELDPVTRQLRVTWFQDFSYDIGSLIHGDGARVREPEELSTAELLAASEETQKLTRSSADMLIYQAHDRFSRALLPGIAALIGFACLLQGSFSRFGLTRQIALAVVLLIAVQFLANFAAGTVQEDGRLWPVLYIPGLAGGAIVAFLLWLASRPRRVDPGPLPSGVTA